MADISAHQIGVCASHVLPSSVRNAPVNGYDCILRRLIFDVYRPRIHGNNLSGFQLDEANFSPAAFALRHS